MAKGAKRSERWLVLDKDAVFNRHPDTGEVSTYGNAWRYPTEGLSDEMVEEAREQHLLSIDPDDVDEEYVLALAEDFRFFCEHEVKIVNQDGKTIPFLLNKPQQRITKYSLDTLLAGKPLLLIILKLRQEAGFSTWVAALITWLCTFMDNYQAMVVSHDEDSTDTLLSKYQFMHDNMSGDICPDQDRSSRKLGMFWKNGSSVRIATAGTKAVADKKGRSKTLQAVHFSEPGFYQAARDLVTGVKSTVKLGPWKIIIFESTPNGRGGYFYDEYQRAKTGKSDYKAWFVAWHAVPTNTVEAMPEQERAWDEWRKTGRRSAREKGGFTEDTADRIDRFELTAEQWLWWGNTYRNVCDGDEERMSQEYPDDDVSCFLSSGRPVFSPKHLERQRANIHEPEMFDLVDGPSGLIYQEHRGGQFRGWLQPEPGTHYIVTADVCSGGTAQDFSTIVVWARRGYMIEQVASYVGRPDPDELAVMIDALGRFYNNAIACPESNTYGRHTIKELRKLGYPCLYRSVEWSKAQGKIVRNKLGFETTAKSRPMLISAARKYMRGSTKRLVVHDIDLVEEIGHFCYSMRTNKPEAADGHHDDYVFAMMIACLLDDEDSDLDEQQKPVQSRTEPAWSKVSDVFEDLGEEPQGIAEELAALGLI